MVLLNNTHTEIFRTSVRLPAVGCVAYKGLVEARGAQNLRVIIVGYSISSASRRASPSISGVCVKSKRVKLCGYISVNVKVDIQVDYVLAVMKWFESKSKATNEG